MSSNPEAAPSIPASELLPSLTSVIQGKTILILGASPNSLGARFLNLIKPAAPGLVLLGGRSPEKSEQVASDIAPIPSKKFAIDMMSFDSVRAAAKTINEMKDTKIDVVINSAGSMATAYSKSVDGFESQLQCNHLGFFLFTNLIMDKLIESKARIVNVSSEGYSFGGIRYYDYNFHDGESYDPFISYGQAKTGQVLFSSALATKLGHRGILSYSIQPGHTAGTNLGAGWAPEATMEAFVKILQFVGSPGGWNHPPPSSPDQNLANYLVAAFDPKLAKDNGAYIRQAQVVDPDTMAPWGVDERQQRLCWEFSEKLVGQTFKYD
ncbi:hypothetical protein P7C73_g3039, partial [Tremellales sp. Uapishka_1]